MPLQTYDELLQLAVKTLARDDLEDEMMDWIWIAENEAQRELDLPMTEKRKNGTIVADKGYVELPNDFVEPRYFKVLTAPVREITISVPSVARGVEAALRTPQHPLTGYVSGNRLYIEPSATADNYELLYYAGIEHLGAKIQINYLLRVGPDYLLYTALLHSAPFLGADDRIQTWMFFQARAEDSMRRQVFNARLGGGSLHMRSDGGHP